MYNTVYECTRPITLYTEKDREAVTIQKNTRWNLTWRDEKQSFKELTGTNNESERMTIALPDELVEAHFKKI